MDAQYYTTILEEDLPPSVNDVMGDSWTLKQNNAPIHTATHTTEWLEANNLHGLDCPARSPNLKIIENVEEW